MFLYVMFLFSLMIRPSGRGQIIIHIINNLYIVQHHKNEQSHPKTWHMLSLFARNKTIPHHFHVSCSTKYDLLELWARPTVKLRQHHRMTHPSETSVLKSRFSLIKDLTSFFTLRSTHVNMRNINDRKLSWMP